MNAIEKTALKIRIQIERLHCLLSILEDLEVRRLRSSNGASGAGLQLSYLKEVTNGQPEDGKDRT